MSKKSIIINAIISFVILCVINYLLFPLATKLDGYQGVNIIGINSFLNLIAFFVIWKIINLISQGEFSDIWKARIPKLNKRARGYNIFISVCLAITQTVGTIIIRLGSLELKGLEFFVYSLELVAMFCLFYIVFANVFNFIDNYKSKNRQKKEWSFFTDNAKSFWILALVMFVCYLPYFISFWPGIAGWDLSGQWPTHLAQIISGHYSAFHPLIYTFFIQIFYEIGKWGKFNFIPLFETVQIILCCLTFSYLIYFLAQIKVARWQRIIIFLFLALNPFLHIFAPAPTKDVVFTLACVFLFIELYKLAANFKGYTSKKMNIVKIVIIFFLFTITRNNAWYAFLVSIPFLIIAFRKYWKTISVILLSVVILFELFNVFQFDIIKAAKTDIGEAISPMLQQMRMVYIDDNSNLTADEISTLGEIFDLNSKDIVDTSTDLSKNPPVFNQDAFNQNPGKYFSLWAKMGLEHPVIYISTFLNVNLSFWYLNAPTPRYNWNAEGYFQIQPAGNISVWDLGQNSDISKLQISKVSKYYLYINRNIIASNIPVISFLTSYAFYIFTMLIIMILLMYKKSKIYTIFIPIMTYLLTTLMAPVAYGRFIMMFVILALPSMAIFMRQLAYNDDTEEL